MEKKLTTEEAIEQLNDVKNYFAADDLIHEALTMATEALQSQPPTITDLIPSHIDAGIEAKKYADMMNSKGEFNGFHELDFYNGTLWLRQEIEAMRNKLTPNK